MAKLVLEVFGNPDGSYTWTIVEGYTPKTFEEAFEMYMKEKERRNTDDEQISD